MNGEFTKAKKLLQGIPESPEKTRLTGIMGTSIGVDIKFQFQKGTENPSSLHPIDSSNLNNLTLTPNDNYRFFVSVSHDNTYLYVFQKDSYGQIYRLLPDPVWSKVDNPIRSDESYRIPPGDKEWFYLDQFQPKRGTETTETLYIIASPWKAKDIEDLYGEIHRVTSRKMWEGCTRDFIRRLKLRKTLRAAYYKEFSFNHGG